MNIVEILQNISKIFLSAVGIMLYPLIQQFWEMMTDVESAFDIFDHIILLNKQGKSPKSKREISLTNCEPLLHPFIQQFWEMMTDV